MSLTALLGSMVPASPPATQGAMRTWLKHIPRDRGIADVDDVGCHTLQLHALVGGSRFFFSAPAIQSSSFG
jgi:hypothetical protein